MEEQKIKIREFLARFFKQQAVQDDDDIFALGFVNSLFAIQLVLFLEKEFGIAVENQDLDFDNFRSITAISRLIDRKLGVETSTGS